MEDQWGSMINNNRGSGISLMMSEGEEFQEVEVWDVVRKERENRGDYLPKQRKSFSSVSSSSSSSSASARRLASPSAPKMVIQRAKSWGNEGQKFSLHQSSAPVKIPDWSQICKRNPKKGNKGIGENGEEIGYFVKDDEENEDEEMIPPHEYVARRLARSRIASYSMCEGIGRTLKGRDLCRLRNAILTQTGFLEE